MRREELARGEWRAELEGGGIKLQAITSSRTEQSLK